MPEQRRSAQNRRNRACRRSLRRRRFSTGSPSACAERPIFRAPSPPYAAHTPRDLARPLDRSHTAGCWRRRNQTTRIHSCDWEIGETHCGNPDDGQDKQPNHQNYEERVNLVGDAVEPPHLGHHLPPSRGRRSYERRSLWWLEPPPLSDDRAERLYPAPMHVSLI